jgi:dTDP-4-amino-4,6-dideoxygalactose transaminase
VETDKLKPGWNKDRIIESLRAQGIPCFEGSCSEIYREKSFIDAGLVPETRLATGKNLSEASLCFLVHPTLTEKDMGVMCNVICEVMAGATSMTESRPGLKV